MLFVAAGVGGGEEIDWSGALSEAVRDGDKMLNTFSNGTYSILIRNHIYNTTAE